jgi:hypothetical protein
VQKALALRSSRRQEGSSSEWSEYGQEICGAPSAQAILSASSTSFSRPLSSMQRIWLASAGNDTVLAEENQGAPLTLFVGITDRAW